MTESFVMGLAYQTMITAFMVALPMLGVSLLVGLVVALFQAMTQINEMTLTFVPKFVAFGVVLVVFGPWMLQQLIAFSVRLFELIPQMVQ